MSALAFRTGSFVSAGNASGGNLSLNKPTGVTDGDRVVVVVYFESDTCTITVSNGPWESVTIANTGTFKLQLFTKTASSEPASYTISNDQPGNQWRTAVTAAYQNGTGSGTLIDVSATAQGDAQPSANQTAPSVTTTDVDRMVCWGYGNFSGTNVGGMSGFCTNLRGSLGGCTLSDALKATAGSTGTSAPTGMGNEDYAATHVAIISDFAATGQPAVKRMGGVKYARATMSGVW